MPNTVYANARAKALEINLLGYDRLIRMLDSASAEEALKVLSEVNFGEGVSVESPLDFERLLSAEEKKFNAFISDTCPISALKTYFLIGNDFHNAEAFIKAKYLKIEAEKMTVENGLINKEDMKENVMLDEYKSFPQDLAEALLFCDGEFVAGRATGSVVSAAFKKGLYRAMDKASKKCREIKTVFEVKADCANIGAALRTRNYAEACKFFVEGGTLKPSELKTLCEEPFDSLKEKCRFFKNSYLAEKAIEGAMKNQPLSEFERLADGYAVTLLKKQKYSTDGVLPFILYCFYKKAEIENVRIIMVGLINGQDKNEIKGRLRETYEG